MARDEQQTNLINDLITARKKAKLTQSEVATKMGVHLTMVQRIENKKTDERTLGTLDKYAEAVGADIQLSAQSRITTVTGL